MTPQVAMKAARLQPFELSEHKWSVEGDHGTHTVDRSPQGFTCSCAARKQCSHRLAVEALVQRIEKEKMSERNGSATALAVPQAAPSQQVTIVAPRSIEEIIQVGTLLAKSGYFKDCREPEKAIAKIMAGNEIGISAMQSLSGIHIVDGRATLDATLVGALIKRSGKYDYRNRETTDQACRIEFFERGESLGTISFTMEDAHRAELTKKSVWKQYPRDMLRSRCITAGARTHCPEVFGGAVYTPEELGANVEIDNQGSMKVVSEPAQPVVNPDKAERDSLMVDIAKTLNLPLSGASKEQHSEAMQKVADALGRAKPTHWRGFSLEELRSYLGDGVHVQAAMSPEHCHICSMLDGTHRDGCPDDPNSEDAF